MLEEFILSKIAELPEYYQQEVLDFSEFLLSKANQTEKLSNHSRGGFDTRKGDYIISDDFDEPLENINSSGKNNLFLDLAIDMEFDAPSDWSQDLDNYLYDKI